MLTLNHSGRQGLNFPQRQSTIMNAKSLILALACMAFALGCNEEDLVQLDPNNVTPENYFALESQVESGIFAAYSVQQGVNLGSRLYFFLNDLRGGELVGTQALIGSLPRFLNGTSLATDGEVNAYWTALYQMVHYSNTTLEGIARNRARGAEGLDPDVLDALEGEARFLRGWAYNELATHYGGVPIYTSVVTSVDGAQPRSSEAETFDFAQADLLFAAENLPLTRMGDDLGRATSGAAYAILGRSHMQENELDAAKTALEAVVDSDVYALVADYDELFTEENGFLSENIYEIVFAPIGDFDWGGTGSGADSKNVRAQEYGPAWHNVQPNVEFMRLFANEACGDDYTDPRFNSVFLFQGDEIANGAGTYEPNQNGTTVDYCGSEVYPGVYKYGVYYKEVPGGYRTTSTNIQIMRYADVLLLLAEIEARQGDEDTARDYLNEVRDRVGAPTIDDDVSGNDLLRAVQYERTVELALEQIRWRDLKRWRDAGILPSEYELSSFEPNDRVLPIPQDEIVNNTNISQSDQNPGY